MYLETHYIVYGVFRFYHSCVLTLRFFRLLFSVMFDEICSIYADALDNVGRYVDRETGECIQQMSIREFCLSGKWRPQVERLRAMRQQYGDGAKKMPEYVETKKMLPGATLSGLFALYDDKCVSRDGTEYVKAVSRRETHLQQHTGWLAIDIDLADNERLSVFENVGMVCRFRPEIALLMRSCSGTGYFGLIRLAYPERHKEQFKALLKEYAAIGITLDKQCGNIGRVRFASWDEPERIYVNENAVAYRGLETDDNRFVAPLSNSLKGYTYGSAYGAVGSEGASRAFWADQRVRDRLIEVVVRAMVSSRVNIAESYEQWCKVGWALKSHPYGERLFHELSACSSKYNASATSVKWHQLGQSKAVTGNYLIHACKVALGEDVYRVLCRQVWNELK